MTAEGHPLKNRIAGIINRLNNGMHEREETIAVSLLAALAGQNAFLLGPPGTAKSLIARRIACAFAEKESDIKFFAYLMQRFSTPDEVFGPISVQKLKEDTYFRQTDRFLPWAEFAFLDEIWKASPAILNTLLTIVNERIFRNGATEDRVSLKALIAASNETPPDGQGLEALYDRFIVRLHVPQMRDPENFKNLLASSQVKDSVDVGDLAISTKEWDKWRKDIQNVKLSPETTKVVMLVKNELDKNAGKKSGVYVSDRRWQKAMLIVKAAAFFCDRHQTNLADALLLRHCLWTTDKNRDAVIKIVEKAVKESGLSTGYDFHDLIKQKEVLRARILQARIKKELPHGEKKNIYKTEKTEDGVECYKAVVFSGDARIGYVYSYPQELYMPVVQVDEKRAFYPLNKDGSQHQQFICQYADDQSVLIVVNPDHYYSHHDISLTHKGKPETYSTNIVWPLERSDTEKTANGVVCYKVSVWRGVDVTDFNNQLYMPVAEVNKEGEFYPLNERGEEERYFICESDGKGSVRIGGNAGIENHTYRHVSHHENDRSQQGWVTWSLKAKDHEQFNSPDTGQRLVADIRKDVAKLTGQFREIKDAVKKQRESFHKDLDSPFVPDEKSKLALDGVDEQLDEIEVALQDCGAMHELAKD